MSWRMVWLITMMDRQESEEGMITTDSSPHCGTKPCPRRSTVFQQSIEVSIVYEDATFSYHFDSVVVVIVFVSTVGMWRSPFGYRCLVACACRNVSGSVGALCPFRSVTRRSAQEIVHGLGGLHNSTTRACGSGFHRIS